MRLNHELAKRLLDNADVRELCAYFATTIQMLSDYSDINLDGPTEATIEMKARQRARATLMTMLEPLVGVNNSPPPQTNPEEYVV